MNWKFWQRNKPSVTNFRHVQRAFAAAMLSRLTSDWIAQSASIDSELRSSLPRLRDRSRQLGRDNDYASNAFRLFQNNVIGSGIGMQSQVRAQRKKGALDDTTNAAIEEAWNRWKRAENCHVSGRLSFEDIERLIMWNVPESGEILIRYVDQRMGKTKTPLALEIIESDLLIDSFTGFAPNGNEVRMGVEVNAWGRPVAYWFYPRHPNDLQTATVLSSDMRRIPADEIRHLFISKRPGQTRGFPWLAAPILRLHQMQGYEEAEVIGARASASLMGFIKSPEGEPSPDDVEGGEQLTDFTPGVFKYLAPGEDIEVPQLNRPGGQFEPFVKAMLRGVAAGAGISYESLSKDYSSGSYSSARQALLEDRDNWRVLQAWIIRNFHQPTFERWLDRAVLSGELKLKNYEMNPEQYYAVRWQPRGWAWIDPMKEVSAAKEAVLSGFKTQTGVISENGDDVEDLMSERKREVDLAKTHGLKFETNLQDVADAKPVPPAAPRGGAKPPDEPDPEAETVGTA